MLNKIQKIRIDEWLEIKETTRLNRNHNQIEVDKLKAMLKTENNDMNYSLLQEAIRFGKNLVNQQTTQLNVSSLQNIANRIGGDYSVILRYERSSTKGYIL